MKTPINISIILIMKKKVLYLLIFISILIFLLYILRSPYYGSIFGSIFSKEASFEDFTNIGIGYLNNDNKNDDFIHIIDKNLEFNSLIQSKYQLPYYYSGFVLEKLSKDCFIYKGNSSFLEKTYNINIDDYKKIDYYTDKECEQINCNIYITENGILKAKDIYNCN